MLAQWTRLATKCPPYDKDRLRWRLAAWLLEVNTPALYAETVSSHLPRWCFQTPCPFAWLSRLSHFLSVRRSVVLSSTATDQFVYPPHHQIPRCGIVAHLSPQPRRQEVVPWHHLPHGHPFRKQRCIMLGLFPSKVQTICTYMHVIRNRPILACGYCLCCPS